MWVPLMPMAALAEGDTAVCRVRGREILLACAQGNFYAVAARCSHAGESLAHGYVAGREIRCPRHGATFDLRTGACTAAPATTGLQTYPVLVEGGKLCVEIQ